MSDDIKQSLNVQDLSKFLGKSKRTIQDWSQKGKIPAHKIGGDWIFYKEEINRWLSEREGGAGEVALDGQKTGLSETTSEEDASPPDRG